MASWFYVKEGERVGPLGREELDARIAEGEVGGETLVWRAGMSSWARASELGELGLLPATPPPPLPPPLPAMDVERTWEPPTEEDAAASHEEAAVAERPEFAGFWVRLAAKITDRVILYGAATLVQHAVVRWAFGGVMPEATDLPQMWRLIAICAPVNMLIALVYTIYFLRRHEATPGKIILGLRVVRADGSRLGVGRIIARFFAEVLSTLVFFVGYVMAAFDDEKRTLHDYLCDTRVVKGARDDENPGN